MQRYWMNPNSSKCLKVLSFTEEMLAPNPRAGSFGTILASMGRPFPREMTMKIVNPRPACPTRRPGGIIAASVWVLVLILPTAPAANADYDYYQRPPYQGGLVDSYHRYNPQLYKRLYPDRVPNNYDYEPREPAVSAPSPHCRYTCPGGPLDPARD